VVDAHEECDGPDAGPQPCSRPVTGRSAATASWTSTRPRHSEQCDDHNLADNDGCSHDCKFEFCGDGIVNNHEACDRATPRPATSTARCRPGDGDERSPARPSSATTVPGSRRRLLGDLHAEFCGNGVVNPLFENRDGFAGAQPCSAFCRQEICGNGILDNDPTTTSSSRRRRQPRRRRRLLGELHLRVLRRRHGQYLRACDRAATPATCNLARRRLAATAR
jgi:cysteine-rich repeat protein